ncbi:MAG: hypothetical protein JO027_19290 [Solirubrobacterales bacterium]|nr:hypothetical protein [Solirubrobacterales bacterium]
MHLLLLYRLREGVTIEEYREWSLARDQPGLRETPIVNRFRVFEVVEDSADRPPQIIESIEISDLDGWRSALRTDRLRALGEDFERLVDGSTVIELRSEEIVTV